MTSAMVWLDSELLPIEQARVSVLDRGLTVGDGVFETIKVVDGTPFALTRHLQRLQQSAAALDITVPEVVPEAVQAVIHANGFSADGNGRAGTIGRLRLTVTHGDAVLGDPYAGSGEPRLFITIVAQQPWPPTATVAQSRFTRNPGSALAGVKSTSYAENAIALREAKAVGADEALLLTNDGRISEGTGSNIFLGLAGRLVAPSLASGCLAGITRALAIEWCGAAEVDLPAAALDEATEAFLTSSTRDIHPIANLAGRPLETGPVTTRAMAIWNANAHADLDP